MAVFAKEGGASGLCEAFDERGADGARQVLSPINGETELVVPLASVGAVEVTQGGTTRCDTLFEDFAQGRQQLFPLRRGHTVDGIFRVNTRSEKSFTGVYIPYSR